MGHVILLVRTDKESFESGLTAWHIKWKTFLGERKVDAAGKTYMCKKTQKCLLELCNKLATALYMV